MSFLYLYKNARYPVASTKPNKAAHYGPKLNILSLGILNAFPALI